MILKTNITDYIGNVFKTTGYHLVNTDKISNYKTYNSGSQFYYTANQRDRRSGTVPVYCDTTIANLNASLDEVLTSNVLSFYEYPDNDITATPALKNIPYSNVIHLRDYSIEGYSWLTYIGDFKNKVVLIEGTIDDIVQTTEGGVQYWTEDDSLYFRLIVRAGELCLDQTITSTGFTGTQGVDWQNIWTKDVPS